MGGAIPATRIVAGLGLKSTRIEAAAHFVNIVAQEAGSEDGCRMFQSSRVGGNGQGRSGRSEVVYRHGP